MATAKSVDSCVAGNESPFVAFPSDGLHRNQSARCHTPSLIGTHKYFVNTPAHKRIHTKVYAHRTHTYIPIRTDACPNAQGFACTYTHVRAHVYACPSMCTYTLTVTKVQHSQIHRRTRKHSQKHTQAGILTHAQTRNKRVCSTLSGKHSRKLVFTEDSAFTIPVLNRACYVVLFYV